MIVTCAPVSTYAATGVVAEEVQFKGGGGKKVERNDNSDNKGAGKSALKLTLDVDPALDLVAQLMSEARLVRVERYAAGHAEEAEVVLGHELVPVRVNVRRLVDPVMARTLAGRRPAPPHPARVVAAAVVLRRAGGR